jgi:Ras-related protein Rab-1A
LVGNKADLESKRQVTYEEGKELADSLGIKFIEASAKANTNVDNAFMTLANNIKAKIGKSDDNKPTPGGKTPGAGGLKP